MYLQRCRPFCAWRGQTKWQSTPREEDENRSYDCFVSPPQGISRLREGVQGSRRWRPFVLEMLSAKVAAKYSRGVSSESASVHSLVELAESEVREANVMKGLCAV